MVASGILIIDLSGEASVFPEWLVIQTVYLALSCDAIINWVNNSGKKLFPRANKEFSRLAVTEGVVTVPHIIRALNRHATIVNNSSVACFMGLIRVFEFPERYVVNSVLQCRFCLCGAADRNPFKYSTLNADIFYTTEPEFTCRSCGATTEKTKRGGRNIEVVVIEHVNTACVFGKLSTSFGVTGAVFNSGARDSRIDLLARPKGQHRIVAVSEVASVGRVGCVGFHGVVNVPGAIIIPNNHSSVFAVVSRVDV